MEDLLVDLGPITLGAFLGYVTGYALKKVVKLLVLLLGLAFMLLQLLAYLGYIEINWLRLEQELTPYLEAPEELWTWLQSVLSHNLPFAAGFLPGLLLGLRLRR